MIDFIDLYGLLGWICYDGSLMELKDIVFMLLG